MEEEKYRTNTMRMRDRVLYCRAFLRLAGKTQIYSTNFTDHTRSRMTHSIEVAQIARTIVTGYNSAQNDKQDKKIDVNLVEAIALAHDLGHTPYGHAGERQLHAILNYQDERINRKLFGDNIVDRLFEKDDSLRNLFCSNRGFKHNLQSARIIKMLSSEYQNGDMYPEGTFSECDDFIEGVIHHTKVSYNDNDGELSYYGSCFSKELIEKDSYSAITYIIRKSDEIAQLHHDIEDAISFRYISTDQAVNLIFSDGENLPKDFLDNKKELDTIRSEKFFLRKISHIILKYLVSKYVDILIEGTIFESGTSEYDKVCKHIQRNIQNIILLSQDVKRMDARGSFVIRKLFEAYAQDPLQMPNGKLNSVFREFLYQYSKKIGLEESIKERILNILSNDKSIYVFENACDCRKYFSDCHKMKENNTICMSLDENNVSLINDSPTEEGLFIKIEYFEFRISLMRVIADYIAGMTDSYAEKEYQKLYGVVHEIVH